MAAHVPAACAFNPHLQVRAQQPPPAVDADGRAHYEQFNPLFRPHIQTNTRAERGIASTHLESWKASPYHQIFLTMAVGGNQLFNQVDFEIPLEEKIIAAFRTLAPNGVITVETPAPVSMEKNEDAATDKYGGATSFLATVEDAAGAAAICGQQVFGLDTCTGFWAHDRVANSPTRVWVIAHHNIVRTSGTKADIEGYARAGIIRAAYNSREAYLTLDQQTASAGGPASQRVFNALDTIHCEYIAHPETPVIITYMQPVGSEQEQERFSQIVRKLNFTAGRYGFQSRSPMGYNKECVLCKGAEHPSFLCPYAESNIGWWGPPAQLSELPTGHPLLKLKRRNNDQGGGRGGRGYQRGGGRGFGRTWRPRGNRARGGHGF
ncbi:hypothetical protein C8R46DRAFT_473890 [Mycena filopes]|nr:hypothetical protein C8R46DRAFT_473890 [Mycena filopes]